MYENLSRYAIEHRGRLNEDEFCNFMKSFDAVGENELTDIEQYETFLWKLFRRMKRGESSNITKETLKG